MPPSHQNVQVPGGTQCFRSIWTMYRSGHPSLAFEAAFLKTPSAPSLPSGFEILLHRPVVYQKPRVPSQSPNSIKMFRATLLRSARLTSSSTQFTRQIRARAMPTSKFYAFRTPIQAGGVRTFTVTNPRRSTIEERVKRVIAGQLGVRLDEVRFPGSLRLGT